MNDLIRAMYNLKESNFKTEEFINNINDEEPPTKEIYHFTSDSGLSWTAPYNHPSI